MFNSNLPSCWAHWPVRQACFQESVSTTWASPMTTASRTGPGEDRLYYPTAALVVEIVSPADETWQELPFYGEHHVDELLIIDPQDRKVNWLGLRASEYQMVERGGLIDLGPDELAEQIDLAISPGPILPRELGGSIGEPLIFLDNA